MGTDSTRVFGAALPLAMTVAVEREMVVVAVEGEIDMATAPALLECLTAAGDTRPAQLVVDLADVTFLDSSGLNVLMRAHTLLAEAGTAVTVRNCCPQAARVLELTGVGDLFR